MQKYFVLLIITDGDITDMNETTEAIVDASTLPLSIVIVGVGSHDFALMNALDADKGPLRVNHKTAARDIVQFVPFNSRTTQPAVLARDVLAEIPNQLVTAYQSLKIPPGQPLQTHWVQAPQ